MARLEDRPRPIQAGTRQAIDRRHLFSISHLAIDYPWATALLWAAVSVAGVVGFFQLKLALFPDITFPVVVVTAHDSQVDPGSNERDVAVPLERAFKNIAGVSRIHSLSYPQVVEIDMSFDVGRNLDSRRDQVQQVLGTVKLPAGTTTTVTPINLNESAVSTFALVRDGDSMASLAAVAQRVVVPRLKAIDGVLKVEVYGASASGTGASVYRYNGKPAIGISVVKRADANTLDVGEASDEAAASLDKDLAGVTIVQAQSQATYIREASRATQEALGIAVLLAILVILPFLWDGRATVITALAIPTSLLGTLFVMRVFRFNLETITLLALALVVGVIVDDAIVAIENIVRHLEEGESPRQASLLANKEIGRTLVATTLTIVAVFLPIGLMGGTLGQFFKPFGLTASAAVLFSLLAARTLVPTLAAAWLRPRPVTKIRRVASDRYPLYRGLLTWALVHRPYVVLIAIGAFVAGLALIPFIPKGFIPHLDRGEFIVSFAVPLGTSLGDATNDAKQLENAVLGNANVAHAFTTIGGVTGQSNQGTIDVTLKPDRSMKTIDVEDAVRKALPTLDGVTVSVGDVPFVGNASSAQEQFAIVGENLTTLRAAGRNFLHTLERQSGFLNVTATGLSDGTPFSAIEHVDGQRAVQLTSDLGPNLQIGDANDEVTRLAKKVLPAGLAIQFGGSSQDATTTFRDFGVTLALSVLAIVAVLVVLFRSWLDPLVISAALPLSIVGALFALWITRADFGLISLMGVVFLFGLVNKNAILLVDSINRHRREGLGRGPAIVEAGSQRLRPIFMTTAATILGMLPIALGFGAGAELRQPMAVSIIGGLVTSTLLSLIVVPVVYTLVDDLAERLGAKRAPL